MAGMTTVIYSNTLGCKPEVGVSGELKKCGNIPVISVPFMTSSGGVCVFGAWISKGTGVCLVVCIIVQYHWMDCHADRPAFFFHHENAIHTHPSFDHRSFNIANSGYSLSLVDGVGFFSKPLATAALNTRLS